MQHKLEAQQTVSVMTKAHGPSVDDSDCIGAPFILSMKGNEVSTHESVG